MKHRVVWGPESAGRYLETRFDQLETASVLKMWTEGYQTVEDIHGIMEAIEGKPTFLLMLTYYEKMAEIFWVSQNYLFHAYALKEYYMLWKKKMKNKFTRSFFLFMCFMT
jgi:translation initiation factor 3 subunit A